MNITRCPWCGKIIDKSKDAILWKDIISSSVPRMLRKANCGHCGHKYGQVPIFPYILIFLIPVPILLCLGIILQSVFLLLLSITPCFLFMLMPYSKLDDGGKLCDTSTDLLCNFSVIEKYGKIKRDELYFLDDSFDSFEPFILASPINICCTSKKSNLVLGEFLYMHKKNYDYIDKNECNLYDTNMNLVAKIRFIKNN